MPCDCPVVFRVTPLAFPERPPVIVQSMALLLPLLVLRLSCNRPFGGLPLSLSLSTPCLPFPAVPRALHMSCPLTARPCMSCPCIVNILPCPGLGLRLLFAFVCALPAFVACLLMPFTSLTWHCLPRVVRYCAWRCLSLPLPCLSVPFRIIAFRVMFMCSCPCPRVCLFTVPFLPLHFRSTHCLALALPVIACYCPSLQRPFLPCPCAGVPRPAAPCPSLRMPCLPMAFTFSGIATPCLPVHFRCWPAPGAWPAPCLTFALPVCAFVCLFPLVVLNWMPPPCLQSPSLSVPCLALPFLLMQSRCLSFAQVLSVHAPSMRALACSVPSFSKPVCVIA